jgi:hypothetical protein
VAWGFRDFTGRLALCHLVSSLVGRRRCTTMVTDI